jgi:hypothetical protein
MSEIMTLNVENIVNRYLTDRGFDGLWNENCACERDGLFEHCDGLIDFTTCIPGYKNNCKECDDLKNCDMYEKHYDWVMTNSRCFVPEVKS